MDTTRELPDQVVGDDMATINLAELLATGRQLQQLSEQFGRLVRHAVEQQARAPAAVAWMRPQETHVKTAPVAAWIDPEIEPAPRATKLLLLTAGGVAVLGHWGDDCVAWAPLPKVPLAIKERLRRAWRR